MSVYATERDGDEFVGRIAKDDTVKHYRTSVNTLEFVSSGR